MDVNPINCIKTGSVIGPLLFLFHISILQKNVKDSPEGMFADDATIAKSEKSLTKKSMKMSNEILIGSQLVTLQLT